MIADYSIPPRASSLRRWYGNPLGQVLAKTELSALSEHLPNIFGYHLVVIDPPWQQYTLSESRIAHHVIQSAAPDRQAGTGMVGHTETWPILTDTLDAILLPHTLELAGNPHQVLREADRCLIPDGHLLVLGFNPRSLWGLRRLMSWQKGQMPWDARFISMHRLKDWLSLLGFDTLHSRYLFQRPPIQNAQLLERLQFLEPAGDRGYLLLSGVYLLVARKRTTTITPIRPLESRRRLFQVGIPSSSQRTFRRAG